MGPGGLMFTQRKTEPTSLEQQTPCLCPHKATCVHTHGDMPGPGGTTQTERAKARLARMTSPLSWSHQGEGLLSP